MDIERVWQIAARLVAYKMAGKLPVDIVDNEEHVGWFALGLIKKYALKHNWRFDGLRSEMGRLSQAINIPQDELHEFLILHVFPYIIAEGLSATGTISFKWSGEK